LRNGLAALCGLAMLGGLLPDAVQARSRSFAGVGHRSFGWQRPYYYGPVTVGWGFGVISGYPLDDSFDPPYGYGEYAEYGPWAYRGYYGDGCYRTRQRMRTGYGLRLRTVTICD